MSLTSATATRVQPVPLRGTQSFVGVMVEVWKRPSLTAIEVLWRWCFGLLLGAWLYWRFGAAFRAALPILTKVFAGGFASFGFALDAFGAVDSGDALRSLFLFTAVACPLWCFFSTVGRMRILRRLAKGGRPKLGSLFVLSLLRAASLILVVGGWACGVAWLLTHFVITPLRLQHEPPFVAFAALFIVGTLAVFVVWMACSYLFHLAPVFCAEQAVGPWAGLRMAVRNKALRSKVVEINLVLGIVKIALVVLAMVLSACPLPFSSVETQAFLFWWNAGVVVWYFVASDFFHVVRVAVCVRMAEVYEKDGVFLTRRTQAAS